MSSWIGVGAVNNATAQAEAYAGFFGDLSFWYLGERGSVRVAYDFRTSEFLAVKDHDEFNALVDGGAA